MYPDNCSRVCIDVNFSSWFWCGELILEFFQAFLDTPCIQTLSSEGYTSILHFASFNTLEGRGGCLLWELHGMHKLSVWIKCRICWANADLVTNSTLPNMASSATFPVIRQNFTLTF